MRYRNVELQVNIDAATGLTIHCFIIREDKVFKMITEVGNRWGIDKSTGNLFMFAYSKELDGKMAEQRRIELEICP